jgi:hypothetical protein
MTVREGCGGNEQVALANSLAGAAKLDEKVSRRLGFRFTQWVDHQQFANAPREELASRPSCS